MLNPDVAIEAASTIAMMARVVLSEHWRRAMGKEIVFYFKDLERSGTTHVVVAVRGGDLRRGGRESVRSPARRGPESVRGSRRARTARGPKRHRGERERRVEPSRLTRHAILPRPRIACVTLRPYLWRLRLALRLLETHMMFAYTPTLATLESGDLFRSQVTVVRALADPFEHCMRAGDADALGEQLVEEIARLVRRFLDVPGPPAFAPCLEDSGASRAPFPGRSAVRAQTSHHR